MMLRISVLRSLVASLCVLVAGGCASLAVDDGPHEAAGPEPTGGVRIALSTSTAAVAVDRVQVEISGAGISPDIAQDLVRDGDDFVGVVFGIPVGLGRDITVRAFSGSAVVCTGAGTADVFEDDVTQSLIVLQCAESNVLPVITDVAVSAVNGITGENLDVMVSAFDPDGDDARLQYRWTSCGAFADAGAASTTWTAPTSRGVCSFDIEVEDEDGGIVQFSFELFVINGDASLANLVVAPGMLAPAFDPAVTAYTVNVPFTVDQVEVTATVPDPAGATIQIAGVDVPSGAASSPIGLVVGANFIDVVVTAESGAQRTYEVTVNRAGDILDFEAYVKASNTDQLDEFGSSIDVDGNTMVVGARVEDSGSFDPDDDSTPDAGAVYVFVRAADGTWTQEAYIKAENADRGDRFGSSVAISGDTIVVGAPTEDGGTIDVDGDQSDNSRDNAGAAYVFVRRDGSWTEEAYLKASNTGDFDNFGDRVAIDGDLIAVGARGEDSDATGVDGDGGNNRAPGSGAVYLFERTGSTWAPEAYLKASNTDNQDEFGASVAVSGTTVVVGAIAESSTGSNSGAAYVFTRDSAGWDQRALLKPSNTAAEDRFGRSVAVQGGTIAVGASGDASKPGTVYVFTPSGPGWTEQDAFTGDNSDPGDRFGWDVDLDGDELLVGAFAEESAAVRVDGNGADNSLRLAGAAYLFAWDGTSWSQEHYIKASNTQADDEFGRGVALSGPIVAVTAIGEDSIDTGINGNQNDNTAPLAGAVYVYR